MMRVAKNGDNWSPNSFICNESNTAIFIERRRIYFCSYLVAFSFHMLFNTKKFITISILNIRILMIILMLIYDIGLIISLYFISMSNTIHRKGEWMMYVICLGFDLSDINIRGCYQDFFSLSVYTTPHANMSSVYY